MMLASCTGLSLGWGYPKIAARAAHPKELAAMPPKKKTHEVTPALEAGNAAIVDLGKMLGPTGANMRAVKLEYDEATAKNRGEIIPVVVSVYEDRSHTLVYKTPPTSFL